MPQTASDRAGGCRGQALSGGKPEEKTELITQVRGIQVRGIGKEKVVCFEALGPKPDHRLPSQVTVEQPPLA